MKVQDYIKEGKVSARAVIQIMEATKAETETQQRSRSGHKPAEVLGKTKSTPKHVEAKRVKNESFGKFYRW